MAFQKRPQANLLRQKAVSGLPANETSPQERLVEIMQSYQANPGRAPQGTGTTGLGKRDYQGYSDMLNERIEYMNLMNQVQGKGPVNVQYGGDMDAPKAPLYDIQSDVNLENEFAQGGAMTTPGFGGNPMMDAAKDKFGGARQVLDALRKRRG